MTETTIGREPVQIVELLQPKCANTFGVAPCTASAAAGGECYNTRFTCQDEANFALGTPLSLFFSDGTAAARGVAGADYIIPSLLSVSTSPTRINFNGASPDASGLGDRAVCTLTFGDHPHTDRKVDPYLSTRTFDPMASDRGSFWTRWTYRNRYRQNIVFKVYEGYAGQALSAMRVRTYFVQSAEYDIASGRMTITGKDVLARIEERKAQAPKASPGRLREALGAGEDEIDIAGCTTADYPAPGWVRIEDEILSYASVSSRTWGVRLIGCVRGALRTTAATHEIDDAVQYVLRYENQRPDTIIQDLLTTYGGVPVSYLDTANWATEVTDFLSTYLLTGSVVDPVSVNDLIAEIIEQCPLLLWWDERAALVKMRAIHGVTSAPPVLTSERHILADSFQITEKPRERASQIWMYYNTRKQLLSVTDPKRYSQRFILANLSSETDEEYGEPSIRSVYCRWLQTLPQVAATANKIAARYNHVPSECVFRLDAKDRSIWTGDTVTISHFGDVDQFGARRLRNWTIISAEEVVPGEVVEYVAEDTTLYGKVHYVMATGSANYPGVALAPAKNAYIGNAAGLLSDGQPCARIS